MLAAPKKVPDALQMGAIHMEQYINNGTPADLSLHTGLAEFMGEDEKQSYLVDGKLYGIPLSRNGRGAIFSKARLA